METLCAMPYDSVLQQKLLYVRLVTCFSYKGAMLLSRTPTNRWSVTCVVPLLYGMEKEALLTDTISSVLGIEGARHKECFFIAPTFTQPYYQYYYTTRVPYILRKMQNTMHYRFVDIALLQQSIHLEPEAFSGILIEYIESLTQVGVLKKVTCL